MVKLMRRNLDWWAVITATIFLGFQVVCDLSLPNLTSNLINNGVAKGNVGYIWQIGLQMLGLTLVGIFAAAGNVYFASTQAQKMGARLRGKIFKKVLSFGNYEMDKFEKFIEMNNFEPISNERLNKIKKDYKDLPK